jgi:hypothetical protein
LKKIPKTDLQRVVEHPVDSAIEFLEQRIFRRASDSPSEGEREKGLCSLGV